MEKTTAHHLDAGAIALATALIPAFLFAVTYLWSASLGHVDWCIPFTQGCTDITHTGLKAPVSHLFRLGLLVDCMLLALLWHLCGLWLQQGTPPGEPVDRLDCRLGFWGAVLLAIGTATLQHQDTQWTLHVLGASGFFALTYLAQLRLTLRLWRWERAGSPLVSPRSLNAKLIIMGIETMLVISVIIVKILGIKEGSRAIEWMGAYAILIYILSLAADWRGRLLIRLEFGRRGEYSN